MPGTGTTARGEVSGTGKDDALTLSQCSESLPSTCNIVTPDKSKDERESGYARSNLSPRCFSCWEVLVVGGWTGFSSALTSCILFSIANVRWVDRSTIWFSLSEEDEGPVQARKDFYVLMAL